MIIDLKGRTAVVSGSTLGIGLAAATGLARAGASVVLTGRKQEGVDKAAAALREAVPGAEPRGVAADLVTAEGAEALFRAVPEADILVNNLGIFGPRPFDEITDDEWRHIFEANVLSGIRLSRHYAKGMRAKDWGRVIFLSSESALNIPTEMIHYGMTKTAVLAVSRGLAQSLSGTGVTVNAVLPGPTLTEGVEGMIAAMAESSGRSEEAVKKAFVPENRPSSIIGRLATPEEVANLIVYLCSPQASATTGAGLRVDGGVVANIV